MARRKAGLNPDAVAKVTSQLGEPIAGLKGPASEIAGRLASGETEPITPYPGYNTTAGPEQGGSQPSPNTATGSQSSYEPPARLSPEMQEFRRKRAEENAARNAPEEQNAAQQASDFSNRQSQARSDRLTQQQSDAQSAEQAANEVNAPRIDKNQQSINASMEYQQQRQAERDARSAERERIAGLPPPPLPPPPGRFGQMANWMGNNPDVVPAALTIGKSLITGRRVSPNPNSEEARRVKGVSGMVQTSPIQTSNTFLYKNYPGMPQGGANQQQAPNGYTKNSVNGQTGPLPQINAPQQNNPGQVNMATTAMPAAGAGQATPRGNQPLTTHQWATAGANANVFAADPQHAGMTAPTNPTPQPIRPPRQVNP